MDNVLTWNIRGLNRKTKQTKVSKFINLHNVKLFSVVKLPKQGQFYLKLCPSWCFSHNFGCHSNGRIILGWFPRSVNVDICMVNSQYIHYMVEPRVGGGRFACTFIYMALMIAIVELNCGLV